MSKSTRVPVVAVGILVVLAVLHWQPDRLERAREADLSRNEGADQLSQSTTNEADQYRLVNRRQKAGILAVSAVVTLVGIGGWAVGRRRARREGGRYAAMDRGRKGAV